MAIFFDIETGGLSGHRSSVLSVSWAQPGGPAETAVASPVAGTWVSRWAEQQVWEPVKQKATQSEQQVLEKFLGVLEKAPKGETLAGWNIGYQVAGQDIEGRTKGFDIPFLLTRAEAYGLRERYAAAIGKMNIRDIGQEYAVRLAQEATQYPQLLEKDVFEQLSGYSKLVDITRGVTPGISEPDIARRLVGMEKSVSGWKQEILHQVVFPEISQKAHQSEFDVQAAIRLAEHQGPIFKGPEQAAEYGRLTLVNKLVSSARKGGEKNKLENLLQIARAPISATGETLPSVEKEFMEQLTQRVVQAGVGWSQVEAGQGFGREAGRRWGAEIGIQPTLSKFAKQAFEFSMQHKVGVGVGLGAAALWMLEPGGIFSGKDDQYNVIEGLRHGGIAGDLRRENTDFGSGSLRNIVSSAWRFVASKPGQIKRSLEVASLLNKESNRAIAAITKEIVHGAKSGQLLELGVAGISLAEAGNLATHAFTGGLTGSAVAGTAASFVGIKYVYEAIKKRQLIKQAYQTAKQYPQETKAAAQLGSALLKEQVGRYIRTGERNLASTYIKAGGGEYGKQSVMAHLETAVSLPSNALGPDIVSLTNAVSFSGKGSAYNVIEGLLHGGLAEILRKNKTPFGSGWRGLLAGIKGLFKAAPKQREWSISASEIARMSNKQFYGHLLKKGSITKEKYKDVMQGYAERRGDVYRPITLEELEEQLFQAGMVEEKVLANRKAAELAKNLSLLQESQVAYTAPSKTMDTTFNGMTHGGMAEELRKKTTDFGSPVDLLKAANRASSLYKKHITKALKTKGLNIKDIQWTQMVEEEAEGVAVYTLAKSKEGKLLAGMSRMLGKESVDLTQIEVGTGLPGGLGKALYEGEADILRKIGYKAGEGLTSPVSNPITARWQMQMYGSKIQQATGVDPKDFASLEQAVINKQITKEAFPGMVVKGEIPQRPSVWQRLGLMKKKPTVTDPEIAVERANRMQETHFKAMVQSSMNTLRPGQRHRHKTGNIVR